MYMKTIIANSALFFRVFNFMFQIMYTVLDNALTLNFRIQIFS